MVQTNWTKLAVIIFVCSGTIFLGYTGTIDSQGVVALLSACLGYVFGNGHGLVESNRQVAALAKELKSGG